jgi:hypothetical protein
MHIVGVSNAVLHRNLPASAALSFSVTSYCEMLFPIMQIFSTGRTELQYEAPEFVAIIFGLRSR